MQKAFLFAVPAVILGLVACNKTSQEKANETASSVKQEATEAIQDIKENAQDAAAKVKEESREAVSDIKEGAANATDKIRDEAAKAGNGIRGTTSEKSAKLAKDADKTTDELRAEGRQTADNGKVEARQTNRDIHEALGLDQGRTKADEKLNESIRAALKANKTAARDIDDISLETDNGNVQIKGTVTSEEMKKEIAATVRKVAGLTKVTDKVNVADRVGAGSND